MGNESSYRADTSAPYCSGSAVRKYRVLLSDYYPAIRSLLLCLLAWSECSRFLNSVLLRMFLALVFCFVSVVLDFSHCTKETLTQPVSTRDDTVLSVVDVSGKVSLWTDGGFKRYSPNRATKQSGGKWELPSAHSYPSSLALYSLIPI